jgi:hypothetical protein
MKQPLQRYKIIDPEVLHLRRKFEAKYWRRGYISKNKVFLAAAECIYAWAYIQSSESVPQRDRYIHSAHKLKLFAPISL